MIVTIRFDRTGARRWLLELADRLRHEGHDCKFEAVEACTRVPSPINLLVELERVLFRSDAARHCEVIDLRARWPLTAEAASSEAVIDLSSHQSDGTDDRPLLRVQSDGYPLELGIWSAALVGRMPTFSVVNAATGAVIANAEPCADNVSLISERAAHAFEGCIGVIIMALSRLKRRAPASRQALHRLQPLRTNSLAALQYICRSIAFSSIRYLYRVCCYAPHWRIGWRMLAHGEPGVHETLTLGGRPWRVLTDCGVRFYADPFPIQFSGRHFIFFEDFDHLTSIGRISYVEVTADGLTSPVRPALEERWHLSYPFLFEHDGHIWMLPESSADRSLSLYRADPFPDRWTKEITLFNDVELSDASLIRRSGQLWMFASERRGAGSYSDSLSLFTSAKLKGPWRAHALNPVIINQREARPAGGFFVRQGKLWRTVQDCHRGYGTAIGLAEITQLNETGYEQVVRAILQPGPAWTGRRLHTLSRYGSLECIDGSATSSKLRLARRNRS